MKYNIMAFFVSAALIIGSNCTNIATAKSDEKNKKMIRPINTMMLKMK